MKITTCHFESTLQSCYTKSQKANFFRHRKKMRRSYSKYCKFFVHVVCIIITAHCINERIDYAMVIQFQRHLTDMKHILIWTNLQGGFHPGQTYFIQKKCRKYNCYFTKNRTLFGDVRYFDAIVFDVGDLEKLKKADLPNVRAENQVYIFAAKDSVDKFPVCNSLYDGFFNWTWTYRRDSTIPYRFISVYNNRSQELGSHFQWPTYMKPINSVIKSLLTTKSKAVAAILDNCNSSSKREEFVQQLQNELTKYNLTLDVFGNCGTKQCSRRSFGACNWRLRNQYFFYLAMEDSIDRDFITEVVLTAYENNVVPIVYGGAQYMDYLPPGSYIDTLKLGLAETVEEIYRSIKNKEKYYDFFKWRNHYQVKRSTPLDACALCKKLAEVPQLKGRSSIDAFRKWWFPKYEERCRTESIKTIRKEVKKSQV